DAINRVGRGKKISLFATGMGVPGGGLPDGAPAADRIDGSGSLTLSIEPGLVPSANISWGLAPSPLIGVWQLDVLVPEATAPNPDVRIAFSLNSIPSNRDAAGQVVTTIAVKP